MEGYSLLTPGTIPPVNPKILNAPVSFNGERFGITYGLEPGDK